MAPVAPQKLTERGFAEMAAFFGALADPVRLKIVDLLRRGERTVGAVADELALGQPTASRHLARLEAQGILARRREGTVVYYRVMDRAILGLCDNVCGRLEERDEIVARK